MSVAARVRSDITVEGAVTIDGAVTLNSPVQVPGNGALLTSGDFVRLPAGSGMPMGGAVAAESNGWPGWSFPDGADSGVGFAQSWPSNWLTATLSFGYVGLTNVGGNIRWRVRVRRVNALGIGGDLISNAPDTEALLTQAMGTFLAMGHVFTTPSTFDLHNADAIFGEVVLISIERLATDALDTYNGGNVLLTNFSINRLT